MGERFWIVLLLSGALCFSSGPTLAQSGGFPNLGHIGPSTGEVVGILVGAGAVIGVVVYLAIPKHKTIEGCVESSDSGLLLTSDKDKRSYAIATDTTPLQSGRRFILKGKRGKQKSGIRSFRLTKIVRDEGACSEHSLLLVPASERQ